MKNQYINWQAKINSTAQSSQNVQLLLKRKKLLAAGQAAAAKGKKISPNSKVVSAYKLCLPSVLPVSLFSQLLGHVLADCSLKFNATNGQACVKFEWGNKKYAFFVYNSFSDYIISPPRTQTRTNHLGNKVTTYCFQTVTLPCFAVFHHLFIENGVKTVPTGLLLYLLTPESLAAWYMDDGSMTSYGEGHGHGIQLYTHCFTVDTVEQMVLELNAKFNLDCWIRTIKHKGNKPIIVIPSRSYPKFYNLVKDYMAPSMMYKLPTPKASYISPHSPYLRFNIK